MFTGRSQQPRGLRRRSAAARLLRSWVRIPPGAWMFVCCECCVLSGRGLCDGLVTRPEESYRLWRVVVCDLETSRITFRLISCFKGYMRNCKNSYQKWEMSKKWVGKSEKLSDSRSHHFIPCAIWIRGWVGPTARLDFLEKKFTAYAETFYPDSSLISFVAQSLYCLSYVGFSISFLKRYLKHLSSQFLWDSLLYNK